MRYEGGKLAMMAEELCAKDLATLTTVLTYQVTITSEAATGPLPTEGLDPLLLSQLHRNDSSMGLQALRAEQNNAQAQAKQARMFKQRARKRNKRIPQPLAMGAFCKIPLGGCDASKKHARKRWTKDIDVVKSVSPKGVAIFLKNHPSHERFCPTSPTEDIMVIPQDTEDGPGNQVSITESESQGELAAAPRKRPRGMRAIEEENPAANPGGDDLGGPAGPHVGASGPAGGKVIAVTTKVGSGQNTNGECVNT